jgi:transposase
MRYAATLRTDRDAFRVNSNDHWSKSTLQPLDNPNGAWLSPMSWVRSVTHVSGPDWSAPLAWDRKMVTVLLSGEDYLSTNEPSRFSLEFKLEALRRMEAGENVSDLARQLGVSRKSIYQWRNRYRLGGSKALRGRGRMTNVDLSAHEERPAAENQPDKEARQTSLEELARAQRQISALERKIGQQQVELDFFQQALRQVRDQRLRSGVPGGTASTKSSKR